MELNELKNRGNVKTEEIDTSGAGFLYSKPIGDYFDDSEEAHFLIDGKFGTIRIESRSQDEENNDDRGFLSRLFSLSGNKSRNKKPQTVYGEPTEFQKAMWVTNKGVHLTFGRPAGDFHKFISYNSIEHFSLNKSGRNSSVPKFNIKTERKDILFHAGMKSGKVFDYTKDYVRKKMRQAPIEPEEEQGVSDDTKSGENNDVDIQQLNEYEFEELVAEIWEEQGWETEVTDGSGDRGIDVIAVKDEPVEQRQYIQAKYYSIDNKVGSDEMQKYSGLYARDESVDAVVVVTTSGFTSEAEDVASNRDVRLIDGQKLENMIDEHID
jgi:hypothetical protein